MSAKVILRFSVYSEKDADFKLLERLSIKPDKKVMVGDDCISSAGKILSQKHKETAYTYIREHADVFYVEVCNAAWKEEWKQDLDILKMLHFDHDYRLLLHYEIVAADGEMPSIEFAQDFIDTLSYIGANIAVECFPK